MSQWHGQSDVCPTCGVYYGDFRTGLDFTTVRMMLWVGDEDYTRWKYKRRHTVLGLWHQLKQSMWSEHLYLCEQHAVQASTEPSMEELLEHLPTPEVRTEELYDDYVPF